MIYHVFFSVFFFFCGVWLNCNVYDIHSATLDVGHGIKPSLPGSSYIKLWERQLLERGVEAPISCLFNTQLFSDPEKKGNPFGEPFLVGQPQKRGEKGATEQLRIDSIVETKGMASRAPGRCLRLCGYPLCLFVW